MSRVALVQMISSPDVEENLTQVEAFMKQARDEQASLVVLPENFAFMGLSEWDKKEIAEIYQEGAIQRRTATLARTYNLWVIAGTIPLKTAGSRLRASCLVYDNLGKEVARYDKIHLFDVRVSEHETHQESATIEPGSKLVVIDTPAGRVGLTVCYDLRFPELYRQLALEGADIYTVPSAFTAITGALHWEVLLRARAIENLAYVLAANQGGFHQNGRHTHGHSMAVEPWGHILNKKDSGAGLVIADVDLSHLEQLRRQFPCVEHHILT